MNPFLQVVTLLCLTAQAGADGAPPAKPDAAQVARLIDLLRSTDLPARAAATEKLEAIGLPALAPLQKVATTDPDPVVVYRAERLVRRIGESLVRKDLERMRGRWTVTRAEYRGAERKQAAGNCELAFVDGMLHLTQGGEETFAGMLELGWAEGRKTFDVFLRGTPDDRDGKLFLLRGIYELSGDTLTLCWTTSGNFLPRPAKLKSTAWPDSFLAVYKRAKE